MCHVCLVPLPLKAINTAYLLSNISRGYSSGTLSGSFFNNSLINKLKYAKYIPAVHVALYSLYAPSLENGNEKCVIWSIGPP